METSLAFTIIAGALTLLGLFKFILFLLALFHYRCLTKTDS